MQSKITTNHFKMKHEKIIALILALLPSTVFTSCGDDDDDLIGYWVRKSDFDGLARGDASSFTIGNYGYLMCGYDGDNSKARMSDLWMYDMERDAWTQRANFPGTARNSATAFALDGKGYLGTGYDGVNYLGDFWEYDPDTNTWTQKADFPGSARYLAVSFGVSGKGYIGCGYDGNYLKDFYSFDPSSNSWTQIVSIGGSKRQGAVSFVIDDIAYVCTGENNGEYIDDFWKYDPSTGEWTELREISDESDDDYDDDYTIVRTTANAFVIDGCAYVTCGSSGSNRTDTWKYYPSTDLWEEVHSFKGTARTVAVSFSNGTRGYIATGKSSTLRFDDIWELLPDEWDPDDDD